METLIEFVKSLFSTGRKGRPTLVLWEALHNFLHAVERLLPKKLFGRLHDYCAHRAFRKAVCVVVIRNGLVLAVARRGTAETWGLPGGWSGSNLRKSAARELREETGVVVDYDRLTFLYEGQVDGAQVTTYILFGLSGEPQQGDAGPVRFVTWDTLLTGAFNGYNADVRKAYDALVAFMLSPD